MEWKSRLNEMASINFSSRRTSTQEPSRRTMAFTSQAGRILRHVGGLGDGIEAGGQRHALVEDQVHDMAAARFAEHLEQQGGADGMGGGDHLAAGKAAASH